MKRSPLGNGAKSLERGSTFEQRRAALTRAATKPKKRTKRLTVADRERNEAWARGVKSKGCAMCGAKGCDAHHIVTKQWLRNVRPNDEALLFDPRNRLPLCRRHHAAHHSRSHPVPWSVLVQHAPKVFQFAREIGLSWWLEQTYPQDPTRGEAA